MRKKEGGARETLNPYTPKSGRSFRFSPRPAPSGSDVTVTRDKDLSGEKKHSLNWKTPEKVLKPGKAL